LPRTRLGGRGGRSGGVRASLLVRVLGYADLRDKGE
jgi:hypothetical protein